MKYLHTIQPLLCKSGLLIAWAVFCLQATGCKKLIEVDLPIDKNTSEIVFATVPTAVSAMTGIYARMATEEAVLITLRPSAMADEFKIPAGIGGIFYRNAITIQENWNSWTPYYRDHIYGVNSVIDGVRKSKTLPARAKAILEGEARFTRAFLYFHLVNNYGAVPLAINIDFVANSNLPRADVDKVYDQIEEDLLFAQQHLDNRYLAKDLFTSADNRLRPNKGAATALLARVYLYRKKWAMAETEAGKLIDDLQYELVTNLDDVFLKESREAIWLMQNDQLHNSGVNTMLGWYLLPSPGRDPSYYVADDLDQSFETGDQRKLHWTKSHAPGKKYFYKYKLGEGTRENKEDYIVFRLAEQFLIRAEARAEQNKLTGIGSASEDLNRIRFRAGLGNTTATTKETLLDAILNERRIELAAELGHRWYDLKRTGKLDARMIIVAPWKQSAWQPHTALQPIPAFEFRYNPSLRGHQNPGYPEVE
jgi:hypothetical protein